MLFCTQDPPSPKVKPMKPKKMSQIVGRFRYDTEKAELIADDAYYDGKNWERNDTNTFLYRTPNGRYFITFINRGEKFPGPTVLRPLLMEDAITLFYELKQKHKPFKEAFPGIEILDA